MKLSAAQALQRGVAAHREGKFPESERYYRAILTAHPNLPETSHDRHVIAIANNNLGCVLQQRGDFQAAIDSFLQACKIKPDYHEAHNNLGFSQQLMGDLKAAIASYEQAIAIKPDYSEAYYNMGKALQDIGALSASVDSYRKVTKFWPDNADAHNALGAALQLDGDLEAAMASYKEALRINPIFAEAHNNIANVYLAKGDLDAAIASCERALRHKSDYANAYSNLGHAQFDKGDLQDAIASYRSALTLNPDSAHAYNNLGNALRSAGKYEEAIEYFDILDGARFKKQFEANPTQHQFWLNPESQSLECLYVLGRYTEFEQRLNALAESGDINRRVAAVSAFVTHQLKLDNPHAFCKQPLDFLHIGNLSEHVSDVACFTSALIAEGKQENQIWEPHHGVTKFGFQTPNTIFQAGEHSAVLEAILREEIAAYYTKFSDEDCALITAWPAEYDLKGWFSRLVKHGHQRSHIHPAGWLSGVVYLKPVDSPDADEGAIELGLHGYALPILDNNYPRKVHRPLQGEILIFPSSLFHRTIPFSRDTERCVIAFDMHRCA